jgi:hypothetical protein
MNRLQSEQQRLFPPPAGDGRVRAVVLEVSGAAPWNELARAWQGVQADLQLPAPAIAVSGGDAYQLWFSLADPVPAVDAQRFLSLLRKHYLAGVPAQRVRAVPGDREPARKVPPFEAAPGRWSAFVTSDLAALFADEPSLDMPPGDDAQAELLSRLQSIRPADLQRAMELLETPASPNHSAAAVTPPAPSAPTHAGQDPRHFLLSVMNDPAVDLHLRIEAAKALLPHPSR